jgi:putative membrane protein
MMMKTLFYAVAFALPATAVAAAVTPAPMPTDAPTYVMMAGASDLFEIRSSQLALEKSRSDQVRGFAQMMIDHHTMTTQQVTDAARAGGLTPPPPVLLPEQAAMIATLQGLSGSGFDRAYIEQQRTAHQMALALHQNYARNGDTPSLKTAASGAVPVVQRHIAALRSLHAS